MDKFDENTLCVTIGKNIKRLRKRRKLSAVELSKKIGVTQAAISDWENGKKMPRGGSLEKLSRALGVKKNDLVLDESDLVRASKPAQSEIFDLEYLLNSETRLLYDNRIISDNERSLVKRIVNALLIDNTPIITSDEKTEIFSPLD